MKARAHPSAGAAVLLLLRPAMRTARPLCGGRAQSAGLHPEARRQV